MPRGHNKDIIVNSFKSSALTLAVDGSEDELIHCLKPSQPCHSGLEQLQVVQQQLQQTLENDPFQDITLSDVEDAAPMTTLLEDSDTAIQKLKLIKDPNAQERHDILTLTMCFYCMFN